MECPLCEYLLLSVVIVVAFIVGGNCLSGRDWYVVISLGTIICLSEGGAGDRVSFVRLYRLFSVVVVALIVVENRLSGKYGRLQSV